ncbi:MAG: response regulator, partial [Acidobacteriota bacterium]|nr:response regulator [Acidobacteriota bacterium]
MIQFPPDGHGETELFGEPDRITLLSLAAHIVVIDDELTNVELLKRMLGRSGFQTVTGITDPNALPGLWVSAPPDLVITDLHMPGRDGFWVLDQLTHLINQ